MASLALSQGIEPAAFTPDIAGMFAASLGMLAIILWMLDAREIYPDHRYRRAHSNFNRFGRKTTATTPSSSTRHAHGAGITEYFKQITCNRLEKG